MATVIKIKTGTATPTTSDITDREVAIDKTAQKFYINDGGTIKERSQVQLLKVMHLLTSLYQDKIR